MSDDLQSKVAALNSPEAAQSAAAAEALAQMGQGARPAAVALVRACGRNDANTRAWSAAALEELGPPKETQIAELIEVAGDSSPDVAYWAVTLLGRAEYGAAAAVAVLAKLLRNSPVLAVRERAAWALGKVGPAAATAVPTLHEAATSGPPRLARLAQAALEAITG